MSLDSEDFGDFLEDDDEINEEDEDIDDDETMLRKSGSVVIHGDTDDEEEEGEDDEINEDDVIDDEYVYFEGFFERNITQSNMVKKFSALKEDYKKLMTSFFNMKFENDEYSKINDDLNLQLDTLAEEIETMKDKSNSIELEHFQKEKEVLVNIMNTRAGKAVNILRGEEPQKELTPKMQNHYKQNLEIVKENQNLRKIINELDEQSKRDLLGVTINLRKYKLETKNIEKKGAVDKKLMIEMIGKKRGLNEVKKYLNEKLKSLYLGMLIKVKTMEQKARTNELLLRNLGREKVKSDMTFKNKLAEARKG